ncbi:hypothetical protein Q1695_015430 [Nippostrongylus brasiliensis]|nr:hypothetical protein Q1695_015430 [Nippostrongylus brasiliensis]
MVAISRREKCTVSVVGAVTAERRVVLTNFSDEPPGQNPVDLNTSVLGEREKKVFNLTSRPMPLRELELPAGLSVRQALEMVLRLPSVCSKRYLTCKVDRSVTGLVARQQCCGPLHTPLADVAVVALSYFDKRFHEKIDMHLRLAIVLVFFFSLISCTACNSRRESVLRNGNV